MDGNRLGGSKILTMKPKGSSQSAVDGPRPSLLRRSLSTADRGLSVFFFLGVSTLALAQPPAPTGLTVMAPYDGEVNLIWAPDTSPTPTAVAYQISRQQLDTPTPTGTLTPTYTPTPTPTGALTPMCTPQPLATVLLSAMPGPGTPVYQDFQVTDGMDYLYQVAGIDAGGNVGAASAVTAYPYLGPVAVQPVTVQNIHSDALDLSWGVPASSYPVSFYQIYLYEYITTTPTPNPTNTATPNFPQATIPASTVLSVTPLATVFGTAYSDTTAKSPGAAAFYYVVMAKDSQGHLSAQPTYAAGPDLPIKMSPPGQPTLSALVTLTTTPVIGQNGYGARLIWNSSLGSEGVTAYQVLQNGTPIATVPYQTATPTMTYDDSTLPAGNNGNLITVYNVVAVNTYGTATSNSVAVTLNAAVESAPIAVTPNATTNAVTLTWSPATPGTYGLAGYQLYKSLFGVPTVNPTPIPAGNPTATVTPTPFAVVTANPSVTAVLTWVDTPIVNHMNYWVQPVDLTGHGGWLNSAPTPYLNLAPTPPSSVGVANPVGNNQIAVTWAPGGPGFYGTQSDYVVYRVLVATPTPTPLAVATVSATNVGYTDVVAGSAGTTLGYEVGLVDAQGNTSDLTLSGNDVILVALTTPGVPTPLPFAGSANGIKFSWLNNPPADNVSSYSVFGPDWPTVTVTPTPLAKVLATQTSTPTLVYAPTPMPWAATYYYLLAQNSVGFSGPATLSGIPVPPYQVTAVMTPGTRQPQISWTMVPAPVSTPFVDSYGIYRSIYASKCFTPVATVPLPGGSYTDSALPTATAGVTYYYRITARAGDLTGQLAESSLCPGLTPDPLGSVQIWPNPPGGFSAMSGVTQTMLYWMGNNPQEGVTSYTIYLTNLTGTPTPIATVVANLSPTVTYVFVATETPGNQSSYDVAANNIQGQGNFTQSITVLVPPAMTPTISLSPPPSPTYFPSATLTPGVWITGFTFPNAVSGYNINRLSAPTPGTSDTPAASPTYFVMGSVAEGTATPVVFEDTSEVPGYVNDYQVVANNAAVSAVPTISAQLAVTLWPGAPNPQPMPSNSAVTLVRGTPVGDVPVISYDIYRSAYPSMTPTPIATNIPYPFASYTDSGVSTGMPYVYWMTAQNAAGGSTLSSAQTIIPLAAPTIYLTPLPEQNQIYWVPITAPTASPVTGYQLYRATAVPSVVPTFTSEGSIVEPLSNTNTVDSSSVSDGVTYIYEVAPSTSNGILGAFSNPVSQFVFPQPVTGLQAVSGDGVVQLRWTYQGVNINSYLITRRLGTAPGSSAQTVNSGVQGVNYIDTGVVDKNFYVYQVYTVDPIGLTSTAASVTALPAAGPAIPLMTIQTSNGPVTAAPVTLAQNTNSNQTLIGNTLSWGGADQASGPITSFNPQTMYPLGGYEVYRSEDGGSVYQELATLPVTLVNGYPSPTAGYFDQVQLIAGGTYTYLVQAFDLPPNLTVPLSQAITTELVHEADYQPVNAYPISPDTALDRNAIRPYGAANERVVNIRFIVSPTSGGNVQIKVYSLSGQFIKELVNQSYPEGIFWTQWDATNMNGRLVASGVYLITTQSPGGHQEFEKVAVIK